MIEGARGRESGHAARVAILAYEGVDELDLVSVYIPLSKAAESPAPRFPVLPLLVGASSRVRGSNGLTFEAACDVAELDVADAVVIPGGSGVHRLHEDAALGAALARVVARQTPLYTICSGVFVLARLGLIKGGASRFTRASAKSSRGWAWARSRAASSETATCDPSEARPTSLTSKGWR